MTGYSPTIRHSAGLTANQKHSLLKSKERLEKMSKQTALSVVACEDKMTKLTNLLFGADELMLLWYIK